MSKWIKLSDEKPEINALVWVYGKSGPIQSAYYEGGNDFWYPDWPLPKKEAVRVHFIFATHWMPMNVPDPPDLADEKPKDSVNPCLECV